MSMAAKSALPSAAAGRNKSIAECHHKRTPKDALPSTVACREECAANLYRQPASAPPRNAAYCQCKVCAAQHRR